MNPLIAFCGLDCASCEARTATINNDNALRTRVAQDWSALNHAEIRPEDINCMGCRVDGVKTPFCDRLCPIRQCALQRGVAHCGECPEMAQCATLHRVTDNAPADVLARLTDIDCTIRPERPEDYRAAEELTRDAFWNVYRPGCQEHYVLHCYRQRPEFIPELSFVMEKDGRLIGQVMFVRTALEVLTPNSQLATALNSQPSTLNPERSTPNSQLPTTDFSKLSTFNSKLNIATFGPISIAPEYKRKGYGLKLLQYALARAKEMGIGAVCMEGNIDFYSHAGFVVAGTLGVHYHGEPLDDEVPYFLAQELIPGYLQGQVVAEETASHESASAAPRKEYLYTTPQGYFAAVEQPDAFAAYEATFPHKEKQSLPTQIFPE